MKMQLFLIVVFLLTAAPAFSQANFPELEKIRKIKPLETTRSEVKRLLGAEFETGREYNFDGLRVRISYDGGDCDNYADWNVPEDVVTEVNVYISDTSKTASLKPLWAGLEKIKLNKNDDLEDGDAIDYVYIDRAAGVSFKVKGDLFEGIQILPANDRSAFYCSAGKFGSLITAEGWFAMKFRDRWLKRVIKVFANVKELTLSRSDIYLGIGGQDEQICPDESKIDVVAVAESNDKNDVITFDYHVSGGKIIGVGANVVWDLSGVKPGTYTITAGADNGCGVCGNTKTKEVIVRECGN